MAAFAGDGGGAGRDRFGGGVVVEVAVLAVVSEAVSLRASMRAVEVDVLSGETCALLAEEMARLEKASAALRAMAAARAADCGAHRAAGFDDADEWLAKMTGETRQTARSQLATGSRLSDCPKTRAAAVAGELSLGQADEITKTEREKPGSEDELVEKAKSSSRRELAEECRKRRQEGVDREALAARQRARRSFRAWIDGDGMQCGLFRFEPVVGVALLRPRPGRGRSTPPRGPEARVDRAVGGPRRRRPRRHPGRRARLDAAAAAASGFARVGGGEAGAGSGRGIERFGEAEGATSGRRGVRG